MKFSNVMGLILFDIVKSTFSSFSRPTTAGFWARILAAPAMTSTSSFTAVPAPTSAARRRPSSRAWRESRSEMIQQCQGLLIVDVVCQNLLVDGSTSPGYCLSSLDLQENIKHPEMTHILNEVSASF